MTPDFKTTLHEECKRKLQQQIAEIEASLKSFQEARLSDTKSSAGDKYETSREMLQQEENKALQQLANANSQLTELQHISLNYSEEIRRGSLVKLPNGLFFVSVGLGKVLHEGQQVFCLSPQSPVGQLLMGSKAGEYINFQGKQQEILGVW